MAFIRMAGERVGAPPLVGETGTAVVTGEAAHWQSRNKKRWKPAKDSLLFGEFEMKTMILGALALCLAAPAVASADDTFVITTQRHRSHNNDAVVINQDGQRLHHRRHGQIAFYDHGRRHHRPDTFIGTRSDRPLHRHRHVIIQDDNSDSDY